MQRRDLDQIERIKSTAVGDVASFNGRVVELRPSWTRAVSRFLVKHVTDAGTFRFQHQLLYLANAMVDQQIGLEETDDGIWAIYFNTILLATFDERDYIIRG